MDQRSTTKKLKCLCGCQLTIANYTGSSPCKNCSQWTQWLGVDIGLFTCSRATCEFKRDTGDQYRVCCECFENMPSNQTLEQRLSFALQTTKRIIQQKIQKQEPIGTYLCHLLDRGISMTINSYLSPQQIPSTLKDEFDGIYASGLKHIAEAIVVNQLGLHPDVLRTTETEEDKTDAKEGDEWREAQKDTQIKWFNLHQSVNYIGMNKEIIDYDAMHKCADVGHCIACLRVSFVLDLYDTHVIKQEKGQKESEFMEIFHQCLLSYNITNLINDFIHILDHHHTEQDLAHLNEGKVIKLCTNKDCDAEKRRYNDEDEMSNDNNHNMATREKSLRELMDLLHSYFAHQNGTMNDNTRRNDGRMTGSKRGGKAAHNKFATYIDSEEVEALSSPLQSSTASSINESSSKQVNAFSFGVKFRYWSYFKNKPDEYIKTPNHASLKDELLKNNIYTITMKMFNDYIVKALDYGRSLRAKCTKAVDLGYDNEKYEIPVGLHLTMPHLLVLMLYTNMTKLQFNFKKHGTRKLHHSESVVDIKTRNMEIANWFKLLYEVVIFFGERPKPADLFYHGISVKLYFSEFVPVFKAPISTTKSITVAQQFADSGIIIALSLVKDAAYTADDRYFAVRWLSCFPEEDEYLFVFCKQLCIMELRECERSLILCDNRHWLRALRLIDEILKGHYFIFTFKKKRFTQRLLCKLIGVLQHVMEEIYKELKETDMKHSDIVSFIAFLSANEYESDSILEDLGLMETQGESNIQKYLSDMTLSPTLVAKCFGTMRYWYDGISYYIIQVLHHLMRTKAQQSVLYVAESDFRLLSNPLQSALLKQEKGYNVLCGDNECKVIFLNEYIWSLDQNEFVKLAALKKGEEIWSESYSYHLSEIDERIWFKLNVETSKPPDSEDPELMVFYINLASYPKDQVIQCDWCLAVDELKWCVNGWSDTFDKNQNWSAGNFAFAHRLLQNGNVSCLTIRLSVRFRVQ